MRREETISALPFTESSVKNWYLSSKPASPKQTLSVRFQDGKQYKYLGTGKVNVGDPVLIDFGGATSYMMGNVVKAEKGILIDKEEALKPLFSFSTDPGKAEVKENAEGIKKLEEIDEVASFFDTGAGASNEEKFRIIDYLITGVLNAITVIAFPKLSSDSTINEAKAFLAQEKPIPSIVFSKAFTDPYYGVWFDILRYADCAEVAFTGHYPGWENDLLNCSFWESQEFKSLQLETEWNSKETAYYLYFKDGSRELEEYFSSCKEFMAITNELVMRSALSILIRGGFVNLLNAALSVEMPIKGFYQKLISFADEINSTECSKLLKSVDYENKTFPKIILEKKKTSAASKAFIIKDTALIEYKGAEETVIIPDGVKTIEQFAFRGQNGIKKVIIPNTVTQIKKSAFVSCSELKEVVLGKNISVIGPYCFAFCSKLTSINLADTKIKVLNDGVFNACASLKSIDLSKTKITAIKEEVFCESGLERILLPPRLEAIGSRAFFPANIEEIVIPSTVKEIAADAFKQFSGSSSALKKITFEGVDPLTFRPSSVGCDCIIICKGGSALHNMLIEQNAWQEKQFEKYGFPNDRPRKLEVV